MPQLVSCKNETLELLLMMMIHFELSLHILHNRDGRKRLINSLNPELPGVAPYQVPHNALSHPNLPLSFFKGRWADFLKKITELQQQSNNFHFKEFLGSLCGVQGDFWKYSFCWGCHLFPLKKNKQGRKP